MDARRVPAAGVGAVLGRNVDVRMAWSDGNVTVGNRLPSRYAPFPVLSLAVFAGCAVYASADTRMKSLG